MPKHFSEYKLIHKGSPLVVIGNGPSIKQIPTQWLNDHITIGMNSFYKKPGLTVDYWCLEGAGHLKDDIERRQRYPHMHKAGLVLVNRRFVHHFEHFDNVRSIDYLDYKGKKMTDFSERPLEQHGSANSVMYFALQLAYYLGGDPTLIVGLDHRWVDGEYHFYEEDGIAHVGPHGDFAMWAAAAEHSYGICAKHFADNGRTLLNITPDTACRSIPTDDLEKYL